MGVMGAGAAGAGVAGAGVVGGCLAGGPRGVVNGAAADVGVVVGVVMRGAGTFSVVLGDDSLMLCSTEIEFFFGQ